MRHVVALAILLGGCSFDPAGVASDDIADDSDAGELVPPPPPLPDAQPTDSDAGNEAPNPPDLPDNYGERCDDGDECTSGLCHDFKGSKGKRCTIECADDADCPGGDRCTEGVCVP